VSKVRKAKYKIPLFFLTPALVMLLMFVIGPTIYTIYMSFLDWSGGPREFIGLDNYVEVLTRKTIINYGRSLLDGPPYGALVHNAIWILIHVPLSTVLGLVLAVIFKNVKGGTILKSIIFLGMVTPMVVGGIMLRFIYDADAGILNAVLKAVGLGDIVRTWTAYPDTALISLILGSVWIWTGFSMIVYSAGLETIPPELIEAAKVDGASGFLIFRKIIIPLLKPATIVVVTMSVLWALKVFDIVYVVTLGGPGAASTVLALEMYMDAFFKIPSNYGTASAIATLLTLITLGFAVYIIRYMVVR